MAKYRTGFAWNPIAKPMYEPARIMPGHVVADFGCGPGHTAVEIAKWVGSEGHVHALDINAEFLEQVHENAQRSGFQDQITAHLSDGKSLPFEDTSLDRVTARNTIMYVDDPVATFRDFHRVLRPGGVAHAIDGDWYAMVAEPVDRELWMGFVEAASHACSNADMGRKLFGAFRAAGFEDVEVQVITNADTEGRLMPMVENMAKYARLSNTMDTRQIDEVVSTLQEALENGKYLVCSPQFVVTGTSA